MDAQVRKVSSRKMHDIVWILVGVFGLFAITFPLAMWRVSNMEKFQGSHVKSLPVAGEVNRKSSRITTK
jgi:type II secretory pathway component PulF